MKTSIDRLVLARSLHCVGGLHDVAFAESPPRAAWVRCPDGGFLLNSGWTIRPAGAAGCRSTRFPMSTAVSNDGKYLLVLNGGYNPPSVSVIDIAQKKEIGRTPLPDAWLGLTVCSETETRLRWRRKPRGCLRVVARSAERSADAHSRISLPFPISTTKGCSFIGDVAVIARCASAVCGGSARRQHLPSSICNPAD